MDNLIENKIAEAEGYLSFAQDSPNPDYDAIKEAALILDEVIQSPSLPPENRNDLMLECAVTWAMFGDFDKAESLAESVLSDMNVTPGLAAVIGTIAPSLIPEVIPYATGDCLQYLTLLVCFFDQTTDIEHLRVALNNCLIAGLESNFYFKAIETPNNSLSSFENSLLRSCRVCLNHLMAYTRTGGMI